MTMKSIMSYLKIMEMRMGCLDYPIIKGTGNLDKKVLVKPESTYLNFVNYNMPCLNFFYVQRETVKMLY